MEPELSDLLLGFLSDLPKVQQFSPKTMRQGLRGDHRSGVPATHYTPAGRESAPCRATSGPGGAAAWHRRDAAQPLSPGFEA